MSKRSDISDMEVIAACQRFHNHCSGGKAPWQLLMDETGCREKVIYAAMARAECRGLIECGVSLRTGWPTEKGLILVNTTLAGQEPS